MRVTAEGHTVIDLITLNHTARDHKTHHIQKEFENDKIRLRLVIAKIPGYMPELTEFNWDEKTCHFCSSGFYVWR